jgi:hypothetical protein
MAQPAVAALYVAILAGACHLAGVSALLRATSGRHALPIIAGVAALLLAGVPMLAGSRVSFWHFAAFFGTAVSLVVFLYGAVLKSLSLAMLAEIARAKDEQLSLDGLTDLVVRPAFATRARLLVDSGAARPAGAGYDITAKGQGLADRIEAVRRFLRLGSLGLYGS